MVKNSTALFVLLAGLLVPGFASESVRAGEAPPVSYELYAHVTAYHDQPGDRVNGGRLNFMGRRLQAGYSAAGPPVLAGAFVEVPDFDPAVYSTTVSARLRKFIRSRGYSGLFVIDDIGREITFLRRGRRADWQPGSTLQSLSEYSLRTGDPVIDIDVMIPDPKLAASYRNRRCRVVIYQAGTSDFRWVPSRNPVWKGRKPVFNTIERHRRFFPLLDEVRRNRSWALASFF